MQINPNDLYERLTNAGEEWAEANAAADLLEEAKRSLIAQLMADAPENSVAAKEAWAVRQHAYLEHVKVMVEARKEANRKKVKYDAAKVYAELLRTVSANERALTRNAP